MVDLSLNKHRDLSKAKTSPSSIESKEMRTPFEDRHFSKVDASPRQTLHQHRISGFLRGGNVFKMETFLTEDELVRETDTSSRLTPVLDGTGQRVLV